jgi:hypothetical protein
MSETQKYSDEDVAAVVKMLLEIGDRNSQRKSFEAERRLRGFK